MAWSWLPLLLIAIVRVVWLEMVPADPLGPVDAEGFHLLAVNISAGSGFAIGWEPPFCPTAVRTPAYPLFLVGGYALLGRSPEHIVLFQVLLEVLTGALVMALTRDVIHTIATPSARCSLACGLIAGGIYALNGLTQRFTGYLLSETLLLPLLTGALWFTVRLLRRPSPSRALSAGAAWGLALLTKPNGQYLVIVIGLLLWARWLAAPGSKRGGYRSLLPPLAFWFAFTAVLFPWLLRNRIVLRRWTLSTAFEENLARVSVVATLAEIEGVRAEPWTETWEYLYRTFVADVGTQNGWGSCLQAGGSLGPLACVEAVSDCGLRLRRTAQIRSAARRFVLKHWRPYLKAHLAGALRNSLDSGHRMWYHVLTGCEWDTLGVVPDIWARMGWSLSRGAVGDALRAFWQERVWRIPLPAGLLWWSLILVRAAVVGVMCRGIRRLRMHWAVAFLFTSTIIYHLILPGPIAHDRFYVPVVTVGVVLVVVGAYADP